MRNIYVSDASKDENDGLTSNTDPHLDAILKDQVGARKISPHRFSPPKTSLLSELCSVSS